MAFGETASHSCKGTPLHSKADAYSCMLKRMTKVTEAKLCLHMSEINGHMAQGRIWTKQVLKSNQAAQVIPADVWFDQDHANLQVC